MMAKKNMKRTKSVNKKVVLIMICKDHESYRPVCPPKIDCLVCWKIYVSRMCFIIQELKTDLKELKNVRRR